MQRKICLLLLLAIAVPAVAENQAVKLRYRSYRTWKMKLPGKVWTPIFSEIPLPHAGGSGFSVLPTGNSLQIDTDGDGKYDREIKPLVNEVTKVETARVILKAKSASGEPLRLAVRLKKDAAGWEWAPGGAMLGKIETKAGPLQLRLIDLNGNGKFNDVGKDAMILGSQDYATYLSQTLTLGKQLHQLQVTPDGSEVKLLAYSGKTASLDMTTSFKTEAVLLSAVIRSLDGKHSYDVGGSPGAVTVPAGKYTVVSGTLGLGRQRVQIAQGRMKPIELKPGATKVIRWGGPISAEFAYQRRGPQLQFRADAIWFYGVLGEQYLGWQPKGKSPEFKIVNMDTGAVLEVAILPGSC